MNPLSTAIIANGNTTAIPWLGGNGTVGARGTFGGGSVKLQWCEKPSATDADWFDVTKSDGTVLTFAAQGSSQVTLGVGYVRGVMSGATTPAIELVVSGAIGPAVKE